MLNFTIPKPLYVKVEDYDVKKPVAPKKPANTKPTFPKAGIPENLVPENILPKERLKNIIETLNRDTDSYYNHYATFATVSEENTIIVTKIGNRFWYAVWFDNREEVVFNYSLCVRNLKSLRTYKDGYYFKTFNVKEEDFTSCFHNKKEYLYLFRSVTPEDLKNHTYQMVTPFGYTYNQPGPEQAARDGFISKLQKHIRIDSNMYNIFYSYNKSLAVVLSNWAQENNFHWVPDIDYYLNYSKYHSRELKEAINTPFFKKVINKDILCIIDTFNNPPEGKSNRDCGHLISHKHASIVNRLNALNVLIKLYGEEMSLDYLQQIWLMDYDFHRNYIFYPGYGIEQPVINWVKENVPVKSFVNMFINSPEEIKDTIRMIGDVLYYKPDMELKYSGRWRATEFHDWIMAEQWKCNHKNVNLPQDLFPSPVKVDDLTFLQPQSTYQLSHYGRVARNCVGSSTYSDGILRKNHFIILALKENAPYLTIQAKVEEENFKVIQIKKQCNTSLNYIEQEEFSKAFKKALEIRTNELAA